MNDDSRKNTLLYQAAVDNAVLPEANDLVIYWSQVAHLKNAVGESRFPNLLSLVKGLLSLPHGNADTERLFSSMGNVKTKLRNSLSDKNLLSILQVKHNSSQSVQEFTPSNDMVMLAKSATYKALKVAHSEKRQVVDNSRQEEENCRPKRVRHAPQRDDFVTV